MTKPTRPPVAQPGTAPALTAEQKLKVARWLELRAWIKQHEETEMVLRTELAKLFVPNPKEGTNNVLGEGYQVKLKHGYNRKLDVTTLDAVMAQMPEDARVIGTLIRWEPTFSMAHYNALSPQAKKTFEQTLNITDAAPQLEIVLAEEWAPGDPSAGIPGTGKRFTESSAGISHIELKKHSEADLPPETKELVNPNPTLARSTSKSSARNTKTSSPRRSQVSNHVKKNSMPKQKARIPTGSLTKSNKSKSAGKKPKRAKR